MKKFLLFLLLFVNLQIVMTKCGVKISVQTVNAQGQIDEHIGDYLCDGFKNEGGTDMSVYSKVPCPDLEYLTCQNCRRLFAHLAELKQHQATCDSEGNFNCKYCGCTNNSEQQKVMHEAACPERTDDDEDYESLLNYFGDAANGISGLLDNFNLGQLNRTGEIRAYDANKTHPFNGNQYVTMLSPNVMNILNNICKDYGVLLGGYYVINETYQGWEKDNYDIGYNTSDALVSSLLSVSLAYYGSELGAVGGSVIGPEGAVFGGVIGGVAGQQIGEELGHRIINALKDAQETGYSK